MRTKLVLVVTMVALQCVWLLGISLTQEYARSHGAEILLETVPVDPRDLLRGDFVALNYRISQVVPERFAPSLKGPLRNGQQVYVGVRAAGNGFAEVTRAATNILVATNGEVVLRGTVAWDWMENLNWPSKRTNREPVQINYGLERFYVSEGMGNPRGQLSVRAIVPSSGRAVIKEVLVDGKPWVGGKTP